MLPSQPSRYVIAPLLYSSRMDTAHRYHLVLVTFGLSPQSLRSSVVVQPTGPRHSRVGYAEVSVNGGTMLFRLLTKLAELLLFQLIDAAGKVGAKVAEGLETHELAAAVAEREAEADGLVSVFPKNCTS